LLESKKNFIKDYKKFGDVFFRYIHIINSEKGNYSFEEIEKLMDDIRLIRGSQGFRSIINHTKNIMLLDIRKIHVDMIEESNRKQANVN